MALLRVEGLRRSFGARRVLRDVTFSIAEGEVVGLVGANGAGKSTLGDIVAGITPPDSGRMTLRGSPYAPLSTEDARWFFEFSQPGDVVEIINSSAGMLRSDIDDWTIPWEEWKAGSALK